ncbi:MAG: nuclear transport factor 2 family protein [Marinovum sp.]|nr:nuclear transport factor 2 family protein [Marinovum sp.]
MGLDKEISNAKDLARRYWQACDAADAGALSEVVAPSVRWDGPWPIKEAGTAYEIVERWAAPLKAAIPALTRSYFILTAGLSDGKADGGPDGRLWVGATGYLEGVATTEVWTIPATDNHLRLRWGEFLCIEGGKIVEVQLILDFVDWFEQIGRPVLTPRAVPGVWCAATGYDAVDFPDTVPEETVRSLKLGRDLIYGGLNSFDESALSSMGMARFFHPNLKWYGPGGIGACLSFKEFEDFHQGPWLTAFRDRKAQDLASLFAEDRIVAGSGTSGVLATHTGTFLGAEASNARLDVSGIDFWLRDGDQFTENWVFVDMIKLFGQMGFDLFARMRAVG